MKNKSLLYCLLSVAVILGIGFYTYDSLFVKKKAQFEDLAITYSDANTSKNECKIVEVKEKENFFQYSFDGGLTWNLDNKYLSCTQNEQVNIVVRDMDYKIVGKSNFIVDSSTSLPIINIDSDLEVEAGSNVDFLAGVTAMDGNYNITNKVKTDTTNLDLTKAGNYEISYTVTDASGNTFTKKRNIIVKKSSDNVLALSKIDFTESELSCYVGESFELKFNFTPTNAVGSISVTSSNESFVTINTSDKSINKAKLTVKCNSVGSSNIKIYSSNGVTANVKIKVLAKENTVAFKSSIAFDKNSYSCNIGETITTTIKALNTYGTASVKSYNSENNDIANISVDSSSSSCTNCVKVKIKCNAAGNTNLIAKSSDGGTTNALIQVNDIGSINFDRNSYSCKVGEKITTLLKTSNTGVPSLISSFDSSDVSIATIAKSTSSLQTNCINCIIAEISCLKVGSTKINALSSTGATTSINVEVTENKMYFESDSYNCKAKTSIDIVLQGIKSTEIEHVNELYDIPFYNGPKTENSIFSYYLSRSLTTSTCTNCTLIRVNCLVAGSDTLTIYSNKSGDSASTIINVESCTVENGCIKKTIETNKIVFNNQSYSCKVGEKINALITATASSPETNSLKIASVASYSSSNTGIAKIAKSSVQPNCIGCLATEISCLKVGTTKLNAKSSTGVSTSVDITVSN